MVNVLLTPPTGVNQGVGASGTVYPVGTSGLVSIPSTSGDLVFLLNGGFTFAGVNSAGKNNLTATTDPATTDDTAAGYAAGSIWMNVTGSRNYMCADATASAAVWLLMGEAGITPTELAFIDGTTPGNVTNSKAVIYSAAGIVAGSSAAPAAAGTVQGNATALTKMYNAVTGADGTTGVVLQTSAADVPCFVINTNASSALKIYPATGAQINALGANAAFSLGPDRAAWFVGRSSTLWYTSGAMAATATVTEQNTLTGATAGTLVASKAIVVDGNKTVDQINIRAGNATIAPTTIAAGTNLTTAAAGSSEFDGKAFYDTALASSRQVRDNEQFACITTNYTMTDTASAQQALNASANGAVTLAAATSYFFEAMYQLSNTGTTSHTWGTLFAGTASFTSIDYTAMAYTGTTSGVTITALSALQIAIATVVPVTAASTSATEFVTIILKGIMRINAGGTVIPQIKASAQPGASGTPGVTMLAGSYFRVWPVGLNTVAVVGNWS